MSSTESTSLSSRAIDVSYHTTRGAFDDFDPDEGVALIGAQEGRVLTAEDFGQNSWTPFLKDLCHSIWTFFRWLLSVVMVLGIPIYFMFACWQKFDVTKTTSALLVSLLIVCLPVVFGEKFGNIEPLKAVFNMITMHIPGQV